MKFVHLTSIFICVVMFSTSVSAQFRGDLDLCTGGRGNTDARIEACTRAVNSNQLPPTDLAVIFLNRGVHWESKNNYEQAIADYSEAIRLNPFSANAYANRGNVLSELRQFVRAIEDYNQAIRINPQHVDAYVNRGKLWSDHRNYDRAIADYTQAIRLNPQLSTAYYNRGSVWHTKLDIDRAIADYDEAIRLNPLHANSYHSRGIAWRSKKDTDRAISDYSEAIRLNPKHANAYFSRAHTWREKGNYSHAIADYDESIRLAPNDGIRYHSLAWLLATARIDEVRNGSRAIELARKAGDLTQWKYADVMETLAAAYAEAEQFVEAVQWQEKALQNPALAKDVKAKERLALYRDGKPYRE